jgi:hypothetical protein
MRTMTSILLEEQPVKRIFKNMFYWNLSSCPLSAALFVS